MKKIFGFLILAITISFSPDDMQPKTITFPSLDGLNITANEYVTNDTLPWMILCHQANFSRGEYKETASKFSKFGYNCLAIDQRSGKEVNGLKNETAAAALFKKKPQNYLDAEQDIIAAINFISKKSKKKIVLVGSSYSASLILKIAVGNDKIKALVSFSPGEYFGSTLNLKESIKNLSIPIYVTSSKEESAKVTELVSNIKSANKVHYIPTGKGDHGSKALWKSCPEYHEYWLSLLMFITKLK